MSDAISSAASLAVRRSLLGLSIVGKFARESVTTAATTLNRTVYPMKEKCKELYEDFTRPAEGGGGGGRSKRKLKREELLAAGIMPMDHGDQAAQQRDGEGDGDRDGGGREDREIGEDGEDGGDSPKIYGRHEITPN